METPEDPGDLLEGLSEAHRLTADELGQGRLGQTLDLPLTHLVGGRELTTGERLGPDTDPPWRLPAELLDRARPDSLLVLRHTGDRIRPEIAEEAGPVPDERAGQVRTVAQRLRDDTLVLEPPRLAAELAERHPEVLGDPAPFSRLLEAAGLRVHDGCVLLPDESVADWRLARDRELVDPHGNFDPDVVEHVSRLRLARDDLRRGEELLAGDARQLDGGLYEAPVLELAAVHLLGIEGDTDGTVRALLETIADLVDRRPSPGWHVLRARLAEFEHDTPRQLEELEAALARSGDFGPALEDHAWNLEDRGEADAAVSALRRAGIRTPDAQLERLLDLRRPEFEEVGRNDPCPCGSGRKYKQCHLQAERRSLDDRVDWLVAKALTYLHRPAQRSTVLSHLRIFEETMDQGLATAIRDPIVAGLLLFEHGMVGEFAEVRGDLLPDDERELAQRWSDEAALELLELTERDDQRVGAMVLSRDETIVLGGERDASLVAELPEGEVVGAHLLPTPSGPRIALASLHIPAPLVDPALEAVRSRDAGTISAWYARELARRAEAAARRRGAA